jgi:hypothetical protein
MLTSPRSGHCCDNSADRALGMQWERNFCVLAARHKKAFTPLQIGRKEAANWHLLDGKQWRNVLLPDVTIWTCPGEHHEIKHKNPTSYGSYGLEQYRLKALLAFQAETQQPVLYTIHDWDLSGDRNGVDNHIDHWVTVDVSVLNNYISEHDLATASFKTYVKGKIETRPGFYWPTSLWIPLAQWWAPPTAKSFVLRQPKLPFR